jgi:hypothetical protein
MVCIIMWAFNLNMQNSKGYVTVCTNRCRPPCNNVHESGECECDHNFLLPEAELSHFHRCFYCLQFVALCVCSLVLPGQKKTAWIRQKQTSLSSTGIMYFHREWFPLQLHWWPYFWAGLYGQQKTIDYRWPTIWRCENWHRTLITNWMVWYVPLETLQGITVCADEVILPMSMPNKEMSLVYGTEFSHINTVIAMQRVQKILVFTDESTSWTFNKWHICVNSHVVWMGGKRILQNTVQHSHLWLSKECEWGTFPQHLQSQTVPVTGKGQCFISHLSDNLKVNGQIYDITRRNRWQPIGNNMQQVYLKLLKVHILRTRGCGRVK